MADFNPGFSERLTAAMRVAKAKNMDIAKKLGVTASMVSQMTGKTGKIPGRELLEDLAAFLAVEPAWLLYGQGKGPEIDSAGERERYRSEIGWCLRREHPDGGKDYGNPSIEQFHPEIGDLIREAIQNVLDQILGRRAKVVFRIIRLRGKTLQEFREAVKWDDLLVHLRAAAAVHQRHGRLLKAALEESERTGELLLLVVEDSGTTGLVGPEKGDGNFAALTKNNLDSNKSSDTAGGAFGLGKATWWRCSLFFTVLFNSDLSKPEGEELKTTRLIGRCEFPWHQLPDGMAWAGPGWFGRRTEENGVPVAVSYWGNRTLANDLHLGRAADLGPGTTIGVIGFHDPSDDEPKDASRLAREILEAAARTFWPAMVDGRLEVVVETYDGRDRKSQEKVDVDLRQKHLADLLRAHRQNDCREALLKPGDIVRREVTLRVPRRTASEEPHDAFEHKAILLVGRAADDDKSDTLEHMAVFRGPRMIVQYRPLRNAFAGAVPFRAALLCGEAVSLEPGADDTKADRFLRSSEPPSHTEFRATPDLKTSYARGGKRAIDEMIQAAINEIAELVRAPSEDLDDGPNALKELLVIGEEKPPVIEPRLYKTTADVDKSDRWVVDSRIRVRPEPGVSWRFRPAVLFETDGGSGLEVEWEELEAVSGCTIENGRLSVGPGVNEARFRGATKASSHPIAARESSIRVELGRPEKIKPTAKGGGA